MSSTIQDQGSLHRYRTELPNLIDDMGLSPHAFRLYARFKRVAGDGGQCYQSTRTLAEACQMSAGMITAAKKELVAAGLISIEQRGNWKSDVITIVDIWRENMAAFAAQAEESACSEYEQPVQNMNAACSQYETKKNSFKKEPLKKEQGESARASEIRGDPSDPRVANFDPPPRTPTPTPPEQAKKLSKPKRKQVTLYDPRKLVNGRMPAGEGDNAIEVYFEIHPLNPRAAPSQLSLETMLEAVDDLDHWREILKRCDLEGWKAGNIAARLDVYRNGFRRDQAAAGGAPRNNVERSLAAVDAVFARLERDGIELYEQ